MKSKFGINKKVARGDSPVCHLCSYLSKCEIMWLIFLKNGRTVWHRNLRNMSNRHFCISWQEYTYPINSSAFPVTISSKPDDWKINNTLWVKWSSLNIPQLIGLSNDHASIIRWYRLIQILYHVSLSKWIIFRRYIYHQATMSFLVL